jgi:glycerophosphoryl diester phosphodiesterase
MIPMQSLTFSTPDGSGRSRGLARRSVAVTLTAYCHLAVAFALGLLVTQDAAIVVADQPPRIVAHRGLLLHAPENTLPNFRACLALSLGFEFDVGRTKDGELVCIHDASVDRTTDGSGSVADLTLDQLRKLDAGGWFDPRFAGARVPTIDEVFALIAQDRDRPVLIAVDLKAAGVEEGVVRSALTHRVVDRLLFIGRTISDAEVRKRLKGASPQAQVAIVANEAAEFPVAASATDADWVYFRYLPTRAEVDTAHREGKRAFIAGVTVSGNVPDNWQVAIDAGIDAILTDYPLELASLLRENSR